jgi:hypothetical protein
MKFYALQTTCLGGRLEVVGIDGVKVADAWVDPEASSNVVEAEVVLEELNRLAEENRVLKEQRDERTKALQREVETLRAQIAQQEAERKGQGFFWPKPMAY